MVSCWPAAIVDLPAVMDSVVPDVELAAVSAAGVPWVLAPAVGAITNPAGAVTAAPAAVAVRGRVRGLRMMCLPDPRARAHEVYTPTAPGPWLALLGQVTGPRSAPAAAVGYAGCRHIRRAGRTASRGSSLPGNRSRGLGVILPVRVRGTGTVDSAAAHRLAFPSGAVLIE